MPNLLQIAIHICTSMLNYSTWDFLMSCQRVGGNGKWKLLKYGKLPEFDSWFVVYITPYFIQESILYKNQ